MQKVVGSNPIIRSSKAPETGLFVGETGDRKGLLQAVLQVLRRLLAALALTGAQGTTAP
jgi:hypothetical protein